MSAARLLLILAAALVSTAHVPLASADPAAMSKPDAKAEASKHFRAGVAAYKENDFQLAAREFEQAYSLAPHPTALWNAADAREKAGEAVRAATMFTRFLEIAPADDKDRVETRARIAALTAKLGRLEISGPGASEIKVDDEAVDSALVFVDPGDHVVTATLDNEKVTRKVNVAAGSKARVLLTGGPAPSDVVADAGAAPDAGSPEEGSSGISPGYFFAAAGVTGVLVAVTAWSGIDTQSRRKDFDAAPTHEGYVDGVAAQRRTNILLGVTIGVGLASAGIGVFAVKWDSGTAATVSVAPNGANLRVQF
ncbi:MAG: tetratricopeptide repeat protein [Deltaproteobacteria bacterium]|nr:tetratricopeptide repeat protein [Deltaproteobacteria bacterium]